MAADHDPPDHANEHMADAFAHALHLDRAGTVRAIAALDAAQVHRLNEAAHLLTWATRRRQHREATRAR